MRSTADEKSQPTSEPHEQNKGQSMGQAVKTRDEDKIEGENKL